MGLDATVYCNCVETGRLQTPHPFPHLLEIEYDGRPDIHSNNLEEQIIHDVWLANSPCEHRKGVLRHHWLGNTSTIAWYRAIVQALAADPEHQYPVLWSKVIYSGSHCGDFLAKEDIERLASEVHHIQARGNLKLTVKENIALQQFLHQLEELIEASRLVNKPISF